MRPKSLNPSVFRVFTSVITETAWWRWQSFASWSHLEGVARSWFWTRFRAARCCCSNSNAQSPAGTAFRSHKRENPACPVCTKLLSSECVECEEQIELRPGLLFLHFLCAFLSYSTHCFKCLILNFPPCFEMHSVSYNLMQPTPRNQGAVPIV